MAALIFLGKYLPDRGDPGAMLAFTAGLCYALLGVVVGLGVLAPRAGARYLHVEDADEIREHRSLGPGAAIFILVGLFMLILAIAPRLVVSVGGEAVAIAAFLCLAAAGLISFATRGRADELNRQMALEASVLTFYVALVVLGGWAALAGAGYAGPIDAVGLIAALALLELVALFAVIAQRGLMRPH